MVKKSKADLFVLEDRHEILVEAIGTEEHPRHVSGLGRGIGFKIFYGQSRSTREVHSKEGIEEIIFVKLVEERKNWNQEERYMVNMEERERVLQEETKRLLHHVREQV